MDVSVIIVNYNTCRMTAECIDSVFEKTKDITFEVILVDNGSTDGSKECFTKDARITYIYNEENLGFGRANNKGLEIAKGRNIFFLNSDTLLVNDAISILSTYLDKHLKVGACGGNLYDQNMLPALSFERLLPSIWYELNIFLGRIPEKVFFRKKWYFNFSQKEISVGYISGADLMVRKAVIEKTGGFSDDFFMYFEETDLCYRIKSEDMRIKSIPSAKIQHLAGGSFGGSGINENRIKNYEYGRQIYYRNKYNKVYVFICNLIYRLTLLRQVVRWGKSSDKGYAVSLHKYYFHSAISLTQKVLKIDSPDL